MATAIHRSIYFWLIAGSAALLFSILNLAANSRLWAASSAAPGVTKPRIVREIAYTKNPEAKERRRQSLDLYLPAPSPTKPPLLIFLHGGYWLLSDDEYRIGPALAEALAPAGVAVALVRYRLAPAHRHPSQAEDVAAAVAHLVREAGRYGYDNKKIFLAGHSAGAHLGALVALDGRYLGKHQLDAQSLAGVIAISGIYDLRARPDTSENQKQAVALAFGESPEIVAAASPVSYARRDAPPFLILSGSSDFSGFSVDAKRFADRLHAQGHRAVQSWVISGGDHFSMVDVKAVNDPVRVLMLAFLGLGSLPPEAAQFMEFKRTWMDPPFSTLPFWRHSELIRSYPIDPQLLQRLIFAYGQSKYELLAWPLERYHAIDLLAYLDALGPEQVGRGEYVITTNVRGEKQFWSRRQVAPYQPVIVVGIDDEKELFRMGIATRMQREYSWKETALPPGMARPLGAFIHFLKEPPAELALQAAQFALTADSFRLAEQDPLARFRALPNPVFEALTHRNGCVYCHSFQGVGARSHHITASSGAAHAGFALPLEEYPPEVLKAFFFDQHGVAAKMGATPNLVDEEIRSVLYEMILKSRAQASKSRP